MLADQGIYVQHLGIGWNEWRYHWETWNHAHEWSETDVMDYVVSGQEPGEFTKVGEAIIPDSCSLEDGLGC